MSQYDLAISFGYKFIISKKCLSTTKRPPINLHISYLPFNRGAHPNFWSWIESTPIGVSIHEINEGIDTGNIIFQKEINFLKKSDTFSSTYKVLINEVESLFIEKYAEIISGEYESKKQTFIGTIHKVKELPEWMNDWDMKISEAIKKSKVKI